MSKVGRCRAIGVKEEEGEEQGKEEQEEREREQEEGRMIRGRWRSMSRGIYAGYSHCGPYAVRYSA